MAINPEVLNTAVIGAPVGKRSEDRLQLTLYADTTSDSQEAWRLCRLTNLPLKIGDPDALGTSELPAIILEGRHTFSSLRVVEAVVGVLDPFAFKRYIAGEIPKIETPQPNNLKL